MFLVLEKWSCMYVLCFALTSLVNILKGSFPFTLISYNVTLIDRIVTIVLSDFEYSHVHGVLYGI